MTVEQAKVAESLLVRGICAAVQQMSFPQFSNLAVLLDQAGYKLVKKEESTSETV